MIKRIAAILIALSMPFTLQVIAAEPASAVTCTTHTISRDHVFDIGTVNDPLDKHDLFVRVDHWWRTCQGARRWVKPLIISMHYNQEGLSSPCGGIPQGYEFSSVIFNWKFWDHEGNVWNPGPVELQCDPDSTVSHTRDFGEFADRLFFGTNSIGETLHPRWECVIEVVRPGPRPNYHWTFGGPFPLGNAA